MNLAEFNNHIEQFADILLNRLTSSHNPVDISNTYVKQVNGSKYIYLNLEICELDETETGSCGNSISKTKTIELTISFDPFYQVPVLHFRVDGTVTYSSKYTAIDIHPIFHTPYIVVHACETHNTMGSTGLLGIEYLTLWFALQMTMVLPQLQLRRQDSTTEESHNWKKIAE